MCPSPPGLSNFDLSLLAKRLVFELPNLPLGFLAILLVGTVDLGQGVGVGGRKALTQVEAFGGHDQRTFRPRRGGNAGPGPKPGPRPNDSRKGFSFTTA